MERTVSFYARPCRRSLRSCGKVEMTGFSALCCYFAGVTAWPSCWVQRVLGRHPEAGVTAWPSCWLQRVLGRHPEPGSDQYRAELVAVQAGHLRSAAAIRPGDHRPRLDLMERTAQ